MKFFLLLFLISTSTYANMIVPFIQNNNLGKDSSLLAVGWQNRKAVGLVSQLIDNKLGDGLTNTLGPKLIYSNENLSIESSYLNGDSFKETVNSKQETEFNIAVFKSAFFITKNTSLNVGFKTFNYSKKITNKDSTDIFDEIIDYDRYSLEPSLGLSIRQNNLFYGFGVEVVDLERAAFGAVGYLNDQQNASVELGMIRTALNSSYSLSIAGKTEKFHLKSTTKLINDDLINTIEFNGNVTDAFYYGFEFITKQSYSAIILGMNVSNYNIETELSRNYAGLNLNYMF